ncbi:MAG: glycosyltransferase family 4 protein [Pseudomonadota bacterium]|nr:glycosyltransferase family 4 protein [Pseudomonadota bacterium]MDQ2705137.1 glycosyltransferase family 4 protein [Pseudomonadota bacterium]
MRIAQVAPLYESVPPGLYGGTERIVSYLTEGLVARGHQVTLFASAESVTSARLVAARPRALRLDQGLRSATAAHLAMLHQVRQRSDEFDMIHVHLSHFIHFPILADVAGKTVTTPHGRLDYADLPGAYACWPNFPMVSISMRQRRPLGQARWVGNVYHGLPLEAYPRRPQGNGDYLAFLGRMSRDKRPDRAIEIARRAGMRLKMAAKIEGDDEAYFRETVEPLLGDDVEFIGEVDEAAKAAFLSNAAALLFPIDWPEPFGLVVIEAMAFGVPVIVWKEGAMPEIVDDGETGYVVDSIEAAVVAAARCAVLDRSRIREVFERRFSADRMVADYEAIYRTLAGEAGERPEALAETVTGSDRVRGMR